MITREADYAVRLVLCLSKAGRACDVESVTTKSLSDEMLIPYRFARRIVGKLQKAGFLTSQKGKGGGLALARPPRRISVKEVLDVFDPKGTVLNGCCRDKKDCRLSGRCPVHRELRKLQSHVDGALDGLTFDQL